VNAAGVPDNFWPVGFPALLGALSCVFGDVRVTGIVLQIAIAIATTVLVFLLGARVLGEPVGRAGSLAVALYPTHVTYATLMLTEPLATLLLVAAITVLVWNTRPGARSALTAGALLGLAVLTRPVFQAYAAVVLLWYAANGASVRRAAWLGGLFVLGVLIVIGPWLARNHRVLGRGAEVSSTGGYNFLLGNSPGALGGYSGDPDLQPQLSNDGRYDGSLGYRLGWRAIASDPVAAVRRVPQKLTYLWALETDGVLWNLKGLSSPTPLAVTLALLAVANLGYVIVVAGVLLSLTCPSGNRRFASLVMCTAAYLALLASIFVGDPRHHYPLMPLAALLAARAYLVDGPELRTRLIAGDPAARRQAWQWAFLVAVFGGLMLSNLWLKHLESVRF
jgi:4-amino-4-deoxy-L-arabinose transferase-like glycosyltransferase